MEENKATEVEAKEEQKDSYTAEEVKALLQKEGDKRVTEALKKKQREVEALRKQIENEKSLSQLDEEARAAAKKDMELAELREQLKDYEIAQTKAEVMKCLNSRGLSAEFADMLKIGSDQEEAQSLIDNFDKLFKTEVAREVKARLAENSSIPAMSDAKSGRMTKEEFNKLPLSQQQALFSQDSELIKNLIG